MTLRVRIPFNDATRRYELGEILVDPPFKNLKSMLRTQYLEHVADAPKPGEKKEPAE